MLDGKVIMVTGASQGVGEGVARFLSKQGAVCVLVARSEDKLQKISGELPTQSYVYPCDLCDLDGIEEMFRWCKGQDIKFDGLVHAARMGVPCPVKVKNFELWDQSIRLNCMSFLELVRCFSSKRYSNNGSSVVAVSSIASLRNDKGQAPYSGSKAMLNSIIKTVTKELNASRIRVNGILPAYIDTKSIENFSELYEGFETTLAQEQPMGKIPLEQVGHLVEFLLSDNSMYITGALIPMEGGNVS